MRKEHKFESKKNAKAFAKASAAADVDVTRAFGDAEIGEALSGHIQGA